MQQLSLSSSQTHLSKKIDQHPNAQSDYGTHSNASNAPNKLYDQPAQLIQQQQIMQQSGTNKVDGSVWNNNMKPSTGPASSYGTLGEGVGGKSKMFMGNKTVLVLAGGNGYQRMALGDNKPFGEHAHCIIWEYKS